MKTAAHSTYTGPGRVAISLGAPRGAPAGYKMFRDLAPTRDILNQAGDRATYERRFFAEVLGKLDPQATWDKLHELARGAEPVIQCFEKPPFTAQNWCHRRMVAKWFFDTLGHVVPEVGYEDGGDGGLDVSERCGCGGRQGDLLDAAPATKRTAADAIERVAAGPWSHRDSRTIPNDGEPTVATQTDRDYAASKRAVRDARIAANKRITSIPVRRMVEAVRAEIDRWWAPILTRLEIARTWSWMGLPDAVRGRLDVVEIVEWEDLQARYASVDVASQVLA